MSLCFIVCYDLNMLSRTCDELKSLLMLGDSEDEEEEEEKKKRRKVKKKVEERRKRSRLSEGMKHEI